MKKILFLFASIALLVSCSSNQENKKVDQPDNLPQVSEDAYVFGLGPVTMYKWYNIFGVAENGINRLNYYPSFPVPGDLPGGSPNNDTYYGKGWIDLAVGPYVVSLPDFNDRYYVFQLTDIYGYNFKNIGNSLSFDQTEEYKSAIDFVLVPKGYQGDIPEGLQVIESPVRLINVLYRIHVGDEKVEGPIVKDLQAKTLLLPLEDWIKGKRESIQVLPEVPVSEFIDPIAIGKSVKASDQRNLDFYKMLDNLLRFEPPYNEWDVSFVKNKLSKLGIGKEEPFHETKLNDEQKIILLNGQESGFKRVLDKVKNFGVVVNGWNYTDPKAGLYDNDFELRSAMIYTGGMYPSMQVSRYANLTSDANGNTLIGDKPMTLTFTEDNMPPATSFWSVTLYDLADYDLVANPLQRYMFSSASKGLKKAEDGSLTFYIQNEEPNAEQMSNWLPAPNRSYFLLFRWYAPTQEVIDLKYELPAIEIREIQY